MERNTPRQPLILEVFVKWLLAKARENRLPLLSTFLFGALAHMFAFTNKLVNHDEVYTLFYKGGSFGLGRWGLELFDKILPNYSMPWIYGILTILIMSITVCLIIHIFNLRHKIVQVLLSGIVVTFPSLTGAFSFMFMSATYALSVFFAVVAVWQLKTDIKHLGLFSIISMILSLSLYQGHIQLATSLLVLILIQRILTEDNCSLRSLIQTGCLYVLFLIVSLGLYYIATRLILVLKRTGFNSYASGNISFTISALPTGVIQAYRNYYLFLTEGHLGLLPSLFTRLMNGVVLIATSMLFLFLLWKQRQHTSMYTPLLLILVAILPLAMNCMYLFTTPDSVHTLVAYSFISTYVFALILTDACLPLLPTASFFKLCKTLSLNLLTLALSAIIIANTYIANEAYLTLYLRYENAYAFYTSLFADLKMMPEFDEDSKLALVGTFQEPAFYLEKFYFSDSITGTDGFLPDVYSKDRFMEYYIGYPLTFASNAEVAAIAQTDEYQQMATYPYYGSIRVIGDTIVVKLS